MHLILGERHRQGRGEGSIGEGFIFDPNHQGKCNPSSLPFSRWTRCRLESWSFARTGVSNIAVHVTSCNDVWNSHTCWLFPNNFGGTCMELKCFMMVSNQSTGYPNLRIPGGHCPNVICWSCGVFRFLKLLYTIQRSYVITSIFFVYIRIYQRNKSSIWKIWKKLFF